MDPKADEEMLALEAVPELKEFVELDPPRDEPEPEPEADTPLLFKGGLDGVVAAIGADTLFVWFELGRGRAIVTGCAFCSNPLAFPGNWTWGRSKTDRVGGGLNFAVAGEMRTEDALR